MNELVSIVMPAYNSEKYISQAIDSVISQTYSNWELYIVDDCSIDSTGEICEQYVLLDSRIKVIHNKVNMGVAETRNIGISLAKGEYICLIDSDDVWNSNKVEQQLDLMNQGCDLVYCSYGFIDADGNRINKPFVVPTVTNYRKMLTKSVISCSTVMAKAELLKTHPFNQNYYHEDYVLWMELLKDENLVARGIQLELAQYRQIKGSRSNSKLNSAKQRWIIQRNVLGLSLFKSIAVTIVYGLKGMLKYYL